MAALLACLPLAACAGSPFPTGTEGAEAEDRLGATVSPAGEPELVRSLVELGTSALDRGEIELAIARFERALEQYAESAAARVGLARVALIRGELAASRTLLEDALAHNGDSIEAMVVLGPLEAELGNPQRGRVLLRRALQLGPLRADVHYALAALTGRAPRGPVEGTGEAARRAQAHPYDPWAALEAARAFLAAEQPEVSRRWAHAALWVADLDPRAGLAATRLLVQLEDSESKSQIVLVHCWADQSVRADSAWRMRLRLLWRGVSVSFAPLLDTVFVPVSMEAFSSAETGDELDEIHRAFIASAPEPRSPGILAGFTARPPPRRGGTWRLGEAEFLGRRLMVRLTPAAGESRSLLHEVLHLYGAVHVNDELDSLMNPAGDSLGLDVVNARIVRLLRQRRFGWRGRDRRGAERGSDFGGGLGANVLPFVDIEALAAAYQDALRLNLASRRHGLSEALEARQESRVLAARIARDAAKLDPHLADVSRFIAFLRIRQGRLEEGARLFEIAARLYGARSQRGRAALGRARLLRQEASRAPNDPAPETR